jgi:hypothetical protein
MKGLEEKGFKLFDVQESFGRSMEDIRAKVVTVRPDSVITYFLSFYFEHRRKHSCFGAWAG